MTDRRILIIAGPNGAGKTTFAQEFLISEANCLTFINADLIAAGLSPFEPERAAVRAGRLMLQSIEHSVIKGESFAFETTLSGLTYSRKIPSWQKEGYRVSLFFLKLDSVELAIERVAERVRQGGHNISEAVIRRRFISGWHNFQTTYSHIVDEWALFDNSYTTPQLLEWSEKSET